MPAATTRARRAAAAPDAAPAAPRQRQARPKPLRDPLPGAAQMKVHVWYNLCRAGQRLREMVDTALLTKGLRRRHYAALLVLGSEAELTQQALSARLPIDRVAMVSLIDDLEALKLVKRQRDPADRRAYLLLLTPKGARVLREARALVDAAEAEGLSVLTPAERSQLNALSRRICGWDEA